MKIAGTVVDAVGTANGVWSRVWVKESAARGPVLVMVKGPVPVVGSAFALEVRASVETGPQGRPMWQLILWPQESGEDEAGA